MLRTMTSAAKRIPIPKNGVDYRGKIVLAPMVRSGECPSRLLALKYGADLVWGPETIDKALIGTTRHENAVTKTVDFTRISSNGAKNPSLGADQRESIIYRLHPEREGKKLIYQIGTANPETAVEAAKLIAKDVAGIDVNAGCPKPFSTSGGMGAALLKTPEKLCSILRALVKEVGIPYEVGISVKIRILDTAEETQTLVRQLCQTGIHGLTVHCRTTPMRPREAAIRDERLKVVRQTCHEAGVSCLINGDVASRDEALNLIQEYGVDGAMIATAAETNPSVFRAEDQGGKAGWEEVVKEYVKTSLEVENRFGNTKYLLGQMIPGKVGAYKKMMAAKSYSGIVDVLGYSDLVDIAKDVDQRLEIGAFEKPKMTKAERKAANRAAQKANGNGEKKQEVEMSEERKKLQSTAAGIKRTAEQAQLDMPPDIARERGPGSVSENVSTLAV
ncbi:Putative aldolase-type TIM barrel, tRNA-dihydrouridine synthase, DUS-like, FMN-binding protein [Septoria linicola]|uniref:Aldolase-type TIM barrel, tRNA-dihydrouridine synthase, DUS-like, FMN-binding protein n=1 Tax=Septoria linicola TaxID=215465 RepID=A0A9Q9AYE3_9PEZI|nr:putative aldolase-type TIM barrel, tRNA-dihydrouridine synthase, DUS-like, FMN-binding protein [Septoria linicola]USW54790.1 Putative aldolase-type TIM barrel, tRNA-dihydrouridine synthase, DUS-like, FMN-binding protein [Septoria linicola]